MSVAFHAPAFSETSREWAALDILSDLAFGQTSALYKKLVEDEQKVDRLRGGTSDNVDPELFSVLARVKRAEDVPYVRDQILRAFAEAAAVAPPAQRVADAKSANRYGFLRRLDNTEAIAGTLARFVRYRRSYDTVNELYRTYETVTPAEIQAAAKKYFVDACARADDALARAAAGGHGDDPGARLARAAGRRGPRRRQRLARAGARPGPPRAPPSSSSPSCCARSCRSSTSSCCSASARPTTRRARRALPRCARP